MSPVRSRSSAQHERPRFEPLQKRLYSELAASHPWVMRSIGLVLASAAVSVGLAGCGSRPLSSSDDRGTAAVPTAVQLVALYTPPAKFNATALAFDPERVGELWVTLRQALTDEPCLEIATDGCAALEGEVALVKGATGDAPQMTIKKDGNAWHFMRRPTSISFGDNGNLSTCGEARTDNYEDEDVDYSGPVLWSSDPAVFGAKPKTGQNGTHIDMLHESPYCMGVAFERDNAYWVFNGELGALDRYDFHQPHAIGGEDHSDGELSRYVQGELLRVPEVPSHLALDVTRGELYVADTGHGRIMRLAIDSGTPGADVPTLDPIKIHRAMADALLQEIVPPGTLTLPSGIAFSRDTLIVTDNASSEIRWFERDGTPLGSVKTTLTPGSLSGVSVGPDGKLYLSDLVTGTAYRVEPQ